MHRVPLLGSEITPVFPTGVHSLRSQKQLLDKYSQMLLIDDQRERVIFQTKQVFSTGTNFKIQLT